MNQADAIGLAGRGSRGGVPGPLRRSGHAVSLPAFVPLIMRAGEDRSLLSPPPLPRRTSEPYFLTCCGSVTRLTGPVIFFSLEVCFFCSMNASYSSRLSGISRGTSVSTISVVPPRVLVGGGDLRRGAGASQSSRYSTLSPEMVSGAGPDTCATHPLRSRRPGLSFLASVKAPFTYPKSSDSKRVSGNAPQFTTT